MPKLSDRQLVILSAAARRRDGAILPLLRSLKVNEAAATTVLEGLRKKGLAAERPAAADAARRRTEPKPAGSKPKGRTPPPAVRPGTKQALLIDLLTRE